MILRSRSKLSISSGLRLTASFSVMHGGGSIVRNPGRYLTHDGHDERCHYLPILQRSHRVIRRDDGNA